MIDPALINQNMQPNAGVFIFPLITMIPVIIFLVLFLRLSIIEHQKMYFHLTLLYTISIVSHGLTIAINMISDETIAKVFYITAQIFDIFSIFQLIIILEMFQENKVMGKTQTFFLIFFSTIVGTLINNPELSVKSIGPSRFQINFEFGSMPPLLISIFTLFATIRLIIFYIQSRKATTNKNQRRLISMLFLGIFLSQVIGSFIPNIERSLNFIALDFMFLEQIIYMIRVFGLIIVGIAFLLVSKKPWLLQQQQVHFLLVYSKEGILLYSKSFRKDLSDEQMHLLAGAFSAVTSMFKETAKISEPIQAIMFQGKIMQIIVREGFLCALMEDFSTQAADKAHEQFVKEFEAIFGNKIKNFSGDLTGIENTDLIVAKYFA